MQLLALATRRRALAAAGAAALLAGAGLTTWILASKQTVIPPGGAALPGGTAGMRVAIQPETGDFEMPSPEQMRALDAASTPKEGGDLVVRTRPDGGQYVDVHGRFMNYSVARRGADGTLEQGCGTDPGAMLRFRNGAAANAPLAAAAPALPAAPPAPPIAEVQ
jgi:hypothetical protein